MQLTVNCDRSAPIDIFIDGKRYRCLEDSQKTIRDLPRGAKVELCQVEERYYWFLFPLYLILGLISAVFHGLAQEEITAREYLHPIRWKCHFCTTDENATITVSKEI